MRRNSESRSGSWSGKWRVWYDPRLSNELRDEAPSAYKDIGSVMRAQRELTRIDRRLRPLLSFKGG